MALNKVIKSGYRRISFHGLSIQHRNIIKPLKQHTAAATAIIATGRENYFKTLRQSVGRRRKR